MTLPRRGQKFMGYFMLAWLIGWFGQMVVIGYGMISDERWDGDLAIFLVLASIAAIIVLRQTLWYFRGLEIVSMDEVYFRLERTGSFLFAPLQLSIEELERIEMRKRERIWLSRQLQGQNQLTLHYLGRTEHFCRWCSRVDAERILPQLNAWLSERKNAPS